MMKLLSKIWKSLFPDPIAEKEWTVINRDYSPGTFLTEAHYVYALKDEGGHIWVDYTKEFREIGQIVIQYIYP